MMVSKETTVSAAAFYQLILTSIQYDYKTATGEDIALGAIQEGLTYVKELKTRVKTKGDVQVTVTKLVENECYEARFSSNLGENNIRYAYDEEDGKHYLVYEEDYESDSKAKSMNHKLMAKIYKKSNEKRMRQVLDAIDAQAKELM